MQPSLPCCIISSALRRGLAQEFERREHFATDGGFAALLGVGRAQQVGAETKLYADVTHLVHARQSLLIRVLGLFLARRREAKLPPHLEQRKK